MAQKSIKGFVVDAPQVLITTEVGDSHLVTASSGEIKLGGESIEIAGGWSFYNLAEIDTKKSIEINLTDTQWDLDAMKLVSGGTRTVAADERYYFGTPYTIAANKFTIPFAVVASSIRINGFVETVAAPGANEFKVTITAGSPGSTEVLFAEGTTGKLYPAYKVATAATTEILTVKTTDFPKAASPVVVQFPIYSDADATNSTIVGYGQLVVYKAKLMPEFGFSGSYKAASEFSLNLKGLDPRRTDQAMWKWIYIAV